MPIILIEAAKFALMVGGAAVMGGYGVKAAGEGVEDASNGLVKLAASAAVAYVVAKKMKVI